MLITSTVHLNLQSFNLLYNAFCAIIIAEQKKEGTKNEVLHDSLSPRALWLWV